MESAGLYTLPTIAVRDNSPPVEFGLYMHGLRLEITFEPEMDVKIEGGTVTEAAQVFLNAIALQMGRPPLFPAATARLPITHEVVGDGEVREIAG